MTTDAAALAAARLASENRLLRDELEHLRAKLDCSQRVADQAIKERDRLAVVAQAVVDAQEEHPDLTSLWPALDRLTSAVTPMPEPEHLHDGTRADKAIRPRGAA